MTCRRGGWQGKHDKDIISLPHLVQGRPPEHRTYIEEGQDTRGKTSATFGHSLVQTSVIDSMSSSY